ncbi:beta-hexosaminidase [Mucilaginibacter sp. PPCGB 2223]|uniref:beta-N-acetylhexosaminidase n=1 Tax=Mucilaginibacter sp. PPCGB 2223 TaxID=1886027 RepID=UPI00082497DF|nr:beta-N-acetylhexosaminidase [Mucilaginibacter sp. PPCGB 2223]OCX51564.1 beta-hexosaminidase [Mucilaginibacter sp. PPCGB 2223]
MKKFVFILFVMLSNRMIAQQCAIIPLPAHVELVNGSFKLNNATTIVYTDAVLQGQAYYLQQQLLKYNGLTLSIQPSAITSSIQLSLVKPGNNIDEGAYSLEIKPTGVKINAATSKGIFYGIASLLQMARVGEMKNNSININCCTITDQPRYAWRGLLLDESRHFWGKQTVKQLLDWMAFYKLNKFHWHLTDEPAWRMEIKAYPLLTLTGGIGNYTDKTAPAQYYTQEDIKEVIAYAKKRFIDVIPEVDMPGHATAANRAYPAFSGGGSAQHPEFTFNPGKDSTYTYLTNILKETDALFPSQMIHLGGDEVSFGNEKWKINPGINKLMQDQKLPDLLAVEHYFTKRMADSLFKLNNKVLLWDEAADTDLPTDKTIIFWWRHDKPAQFKKALSKGYSVVMCPRLPFYFDFVQDTTQHFGRRWNGGYVPLDRLYNFTVADQGITAEQQKQILGVQAALWTENILTKEKLQYMLFPRIAALAETAWTADGQKNLPQFKERVKLQLKLYQQDGLYFYDPFQPTQTPEPLSAKELSLIKDQIQKQ